MPQDIAASQLRAARAMVNWTREQLAGAAGTTTRTLARLEAGETKARASTAAAIRSALESAGVRFTETGVEISEKGAATGRIAQATRKIGDGD